MKKCLLMLGLLVLAGFARADSGFLQTVPADDFASAGLKKLTPEELARLEALVQSYKSGELAEARRQAEAKAAAAQIEAEQKIVVAETKAREAVAKADAAVAKAREAESRVAAEPAKKQPGWFMALITLKQAGEKPEKEQPLESRLAGDFDGWNGHSIFSLDDGTRWQQQNKTESYVYAPTLHSPKVRITPAAISGFWLEIVGVNQQVRVVPIALPEQK
jgi:hypothetical protein